MTESPTTSGADLARQALAAARAAAKNTPAPGLGSKKTRRSIRPARGEHGDPQGLGRILGKLTAEQGWDASINGGNLIDQWTSLCPTELATTVQPIAYDADRGILSLRPSSPAYATQLRLSQQQLAKHLNDKLGRPAVRTIRVLPPGGHTPAAVAEQTTPAPQEAPVQPRRPAPDGYRLARELLLENRPEWAPSDPYTVEAMRRQEAALRANRQRENEHRDAVWAQDDTERKAGPKPGSVEASLAAARAYKRREAAGLEVPRRAFDVA